MSRRPRHRVAVALLAATAVVLAGCARPSDAGPATAGATDGAVTKAAVAPGSHRVSLTVDGRARSYLLRIPPQAVGASDFESRPLVIELHGGGGDGPGMERLTRFGDETDARGWLLAVPDGVARRWDDGRAGIGSDVDDVAFIAALIDDVAARAALDRTRVFAAGISNGAMMAGRLACDLAGRIAAVAQVAGTLGVDASARCAPARPVSVLVIAGTADPLVPFEGGVVGSGLGLSRGTVVGVEPYVADWRARDGLAEVPPEVSGLGADTTVTTFRVGTGTRVTSYRVDGGGHTWPGGPQYLPAFLVGTVTHTFSATRVIADFFASVPPSRSG